MERLFQTLDEVEDLLRVIGHLLRSPGLAAALGRGLRRRNAGAAPGAPGQAPRRDRQASALSAPAR